MSTIVNEDVLRIFPLCWYFGFPRRGKEQEMNGKFFLYINFNVVEKGQPSHVWGAVQYDSIPDATEAAKRELENIGASTVQIFQLVGTAKKGVVIE